MNPLILTNKGSPPITYKHAFIRTFITGKTKEAIKSISQTLQSAYLSSLSNKKFKNLVSSLTEEVIKATNQASQHSKFSESISLLVNFIKLLNNFRELAIENQRLQAVNQLSILYRKNNNLQAAWNTLEKDKQMLQSVQVQGETKASIHLNWCNLYMIRGVRTQAVKHCQRAIEILQHSQSKSQLLGIAYYNMGVYYEQQLNVNQGLHSYAKAYQILRQKSKDWNTKKMVKSAYKRLKKSREIFEPKITQFDHGSEKERQKYTYSQHSLHSQDSFKVYKNQQVPFIKPVKSRTIHQNSRLLSFLKPGTIQSLAKPGRIMNVQTLKRPQSNYMRRQNKTASEKFQSYSQTQSRMEVQSLKSMRPECQVQMQQNFEPIRAVPNLKMHQREFIEQPLDSKQNTQTNQEEIEVIQIEEPVKIVTLPKQRAQVILRIGKRIDREFYMISIIKNSRNLIVEAKGKMDFSIQLPLQILETKSPSEIVSNLQIINSKLYLRPERSLWIQLLRKIQLINNSEYMVTVQVNQA